MKIFRNRKSSCLPGQTFFSLTSVRFVERSANKSRTARWEFQCVCGNLVVHSYSAVRRGLSKHCGCRATENRRKVQVKHGYKYTRFYRCWRGMLTRCLDPNTAAYARYGGRGIRVCEKWLSFKGFLEDMLEGYSDKLSIERINNNKGYYKANCKWATVKEQNRNTSVTIKVRYRGKTWKLRELTEALGLSYARVWDRLNKSKWPLERALHEPIQEHKNRYRKKVVHFTRVIEG